MLHCPYNTRVILLHQRANYYLDQDFIERIVLLDLSTIEELNELGPPLVVHFFLVITRSNLLNSFSFQGHPLPHFSMGMHTWCIIEKGAKHASREFFNGGIPKILTIRIFRTNVNHIDKQIVNVSKIKPKLLNVNCKFYNS